MASAQSQESRNLVRSCFSPVCPVSEVQLLLSIFLLSPAERAGGGAREAGGPLPATLHLQGQDATGKKGAPGRRVLEVSKRLFVFYDWKQNG